MSTISRRFSRRLAALLLTPLIAGACAVPQATVRGAPPGIENVRLQPYDGPRARIAVAKFDDKTAKGAREIGDGMATMLTTALVNSGRFLVLERDVLNEVLREQDLGASGRVKAETAAPIGEVEGAEVLILGAVTGFEPEKMGLGGGIIGLGTLIGSAILHESNKNLPIAAATYKESEISIDVRAVDAATSRVLFTVSIDAKGIDWGGGVIGEIGGGHTRLPLAFGGFQNAATEQAVRRAIDLAVAELARRTPAEYFRHRPEEFASGRMEAFAYLDIPGLSGERFAEPGVRSASTPEEWAALAPQLGLAGKDAAPPVDFSVQRVAAVFAGTQDVPGRSVSVEKAVAHPDRIELTASLATPPEGSPALKPTPALLHPMALVRLEQGAPVSLAWKTQTP